jgi:hypothetical protein
MRKALVVLFLVLAGAFAFARESAPLGAQEGVIARLRICRGVTAKTASRVGPS